MRNRISNDIIDEDDLAKQLENLYLRTNPATVTKVVFNDTTTHRIPILLLLTKMTKERVAGKYNYKNDAAKLFGKFRREELRRQVSDPSFRYDHTTMTPWMSGILANHGITNEDDAKEVYNSLYQNQRKKLKVCLCILFLLCINNFTSYPPFILL